MSSVRLITTATVGAYARAYRDAATALRRWVAIVEDAEWQSIDDVRRVFPSADAAIAESGATVTIFNICGNKYRLIVAVHYNRQRAYVRDFLTHAEYSKGHWKRRH